MITQTDPRWRQLQELGVTCASCGATHQGIFDLACGKPDAWPHDETKEPNGALRLDGNFLSEDFCVVEGKHFIIRSVLTIPVVGTSESFGYGVWSTLSHKNFDRYVETFDSGKQAELGCMFSWLMNRLDGYPDTFSLKSQLKPRDGRQRPVVILESEDHPLAIEQRDGITFDRLLDIYAMHGHDLHSRFLLT